MSVSCVWVSQTSLTRAEEDWDDESTLESGYKYSKVQRPAFPRAASRSSIVLTEVPADHG